MPTNPDNLDVAMLDDLPLAMFWCDETLKVSMCNQLFRELVGVEHQHPHCDGASIDELLPHEITKELVPALSDWDAAKELSEFGVKVFDKLGNLTSYAVIVKKIESDRVGGRGYSGSIQNFSRVFSSEGAIVEEHELLRTVIDILPAFIYAKDRNSKFIIANEVLAGFMGLRGSDDLIGKSDFDFFPYKNAMKYYCDEQEIIASGKPKINLQESCGFDDSNDSIWLNTTKVPLKDASGNIVGIVGTGFDVSSQKRINDQLRMLQEIVNNSNSCAFLLSSHDNWQVTFCSKTVSIFGYVEEDFSDCRLNFLEIVHPDDIEDVSNGTKNGFRDGLKSFRQEYRIRKKDGGYCWVEDQKHLREVQEDGSYLFQSLITDISMRHKFQEERDEMEIQLRQAQKLEAVGQLAAGIAHEINTPIQFISDNLQFLMESADEFRSFYRGVNEQLKAAEVSVERLQNRVNELSEKHDLDFLLDEVPLAVSQSLDGAHRVRDIVKAMKEFSHPGSGEITHEDLNQAILTTITVARNEWKYVADVETELDSQIVTVPVDIGPIKQTILNLIVNAAHAIEDRVKAGDFEKGTITVRSKLKPDSVVIEIEDTGKGMPAKVAERVFDPFFTTKEVGKGTGQGLAMAYDIVVRKHKGKLNFNTTEGQGTVFFMELPKTQQKSGEETQF